jgi:4,5-dihydroxyphthalate decarboxylase
MADIHLTLASKDYDHLQDLKNGSVKPEGIALTCINMPPTDVFHRFLTYKEWEVSELSMSKYCSLLAEDRADMIGLPVFPTRVFRQSSVYIRRGGPIKNPEDMKGKRCGIPEWAQTATTYARGWLAHNVGVPLDSIDWVQGGINEPGRAEKVNLALPPGIRLKTVSDRSLNDLLLAGEIDCIICASPPRASVGAKPEIVPLLPDTQAAEEAYFRQTGIIPIMHLIVLRKDVYQRNPWIAMNLLLAFEEAKQRSIERLTSRSPRYAIPWIRLYIQRMQDLLFGDGEYWPYGLEPNRRTLEAFLTYCHEQGICRRKLAPEELFAPETLTRTKH